MDELRALRLFHTVAATGSLRQAAVSEGLTPQAVSKSIAQLEQHLGVRLLSRTTRRSSLTQEGMQLREQTAGPIEDLANALRRVRSASEGISGTLRLSAAPSARKVLIAPLAAFCNRHPDVTLEFIAANTFTDTVLEQVDVGFRAGLMPQGEVVARRLFTVPQVVCVAPAYLARHGTPSTPDELRQHAARDSATTPPDACCLGSWRTSDGRSPSMSARSFAPTIPRWNWPSFARAWRSA
jgi:DNA-binding transcriptional LysR family regulator